MGGCQALLFYRWNAEAFDFVGGSVAVGCYDIRRGSGPENQQSSDEWCRVDAIPRTHLALGVLITSLTTLLSTGGDLRLTGITKKIDSILMVTQLAGIFQTLDSVEEAIESHTSICK